MLGVALPGGWDGPNNLPSLLCSETRHPTPRPSEKFLDLERVRLSASEFQLENKDPQSRILRLLGQQVGKCPSSVRHVEVGPATRAAELPGQRAARREPFPYGKTDCLAVDSFKAQLEYTLIQIAVWRWSATFS